MALVFSYLEDCYPVKKVGNTYQIMESNPLVSVVIPTYNRPDLLVRAVDSVQNQSYSNIEIIVVDDASKIEPGKVLSGYKGLYFFRNSVNMGACYSRNIGLSKAKGDFINFLDDDDVLCPEKIEKQVDLFLTSKDDCLGMVTCHSKDERSGKTKIKYNRVKGDIYRKLLDRYTVSGTETLLIMTEAVKNAGGFDEQLQSSHEYDLLIRLAKNYTIDFVDEVLTREYRSVNQISTNFDKKIQGARYLYSKHDHRFKEIGYGFWLKKKLKLQILLIRFYIGKMFGENVYRMLLRE
ncbi:MAG: glycosyltransferase family 2 protein [Gracilimonas sp.]|nr:glycosyltransferase family 2 protein [Gracilimonas sp.]